MLHASEARDPSPLGAGVVFFVDSARNPLAAPTLELFLFFAGKVRNPLPPQRGSKKFAPAVYPTKRTIGCRIVGTWLCARLRGIPIVCASANPL
jgi:hypothetical protein